MRPTCRLACRMVLLVGLGPATGSLPAGAAEWLPATTDPPRAIDHAVGQHLEKAGITAAPAADWPTLLRRTALDLAGRIPTLAEYEWLESLPEAERRLAMVDHLMALVDFDLHLRNGLDELLLPNNPHNGEFRDYLLWAVQSRRSWDQMFRDLMAARPSEGPEKGAVHFVRSRVRDVDELTNDTAILLFGVNVSCAKCHDHPLVDRWQQQHFYGMQAFFSRTFMTRQNVVTERPFGQVTFKTTAGEDKTASLTFLNGVTIEDRSPTFTEEERKRLEEQLRKMEQSDKVGYVIFPDFSPRRELVEAALKDTEQRFFPRNIVNRIWQRLMGVALVDPPDQMHAGNPPSHPELMDWLTRDLVDHRYDLRRLVRGIVLSDAYARSSRWTSADTPPPPASYALAATRPLTPRQMATSLLVASRGTAMDVATAAEPGGAWSRQRLDLENQAGGWVREFEYPVEGFQVAVDEALFMSNNERVQNDLLRDTGDSLVGRLKASATDDAIVRHVWRSVLTRDPSADEAAAATEWLARHPDDRLGSIRSLAWALIAGPEARFAR
ncbi:MAG: DUF1553 domain-containing protein [Planctomycetaceae bacterium]